MLIAGALAIFAEWQFGLSLESLVLGPARDRIMAVANAIGRDLDATPYAERGEVLASYSQRYGVEFFLVNPDGGPLAGDAVELPPPVLERMHTRPGGGRGAPGRRPRPEPREPDTAGRGDAPDPPPPPPSPPPPRRPGELRTEPAFLTVTHNPLRFWVGVGIPTNGPEGEPGVPAVLLLRADSILNSRLFFDWRRLVLLAATLAALALACWWPFLHGVTQAIRQMGGATEQIAEGRFDRHVTLERQDELGHLGGQINRMAARLEGFVKQQKRFLGDIAHELCAPIARIQFALGILEQKIEEPQQAHLAVLREEIQEMSGLVNELLLFSKAGVQEAETPLRRVELGAAVERAVARQFPGTGTIETSVPPGLAVAAHEPYLVRAVSNLLRNALRYAGEAGPVRVTARREGGKVLLSVADRGPGLPEGSHEEVFAPFYRPETARSRETGGVGLGLAIVKSCVEACRGSVVCRNCEPSGLEVTITLPAWEG